MIILVATLTMCAIAAEMRHVGTQIHYMQYTLHMYIITILQYICYIYIRCYLVFCGTAAAY